LCEVAHLPILPLLAVIVMALMTKVTFLMTKGIIQRWSRLILPSSLSHLMIEKSWVTFQQIRTT